MSITDEELEAWLKRAGLGWGLPAADTFRLLAELSQLRAQAAWRPIESAPRDGRTFLAYLADDPRAYQPHLTPLPWMGLARFNPHYPDGPPTIEYENYRHHPRAGVMPTHWMPLPPPPQNPRKEDER